MRRLFALVIAVVAIGGLACGGSAAAPAPVPPSVSPSIADSGAYPTTPARSATLNPTARPQPPSVAPGGCGALPAGIAPGVTSVRKIESAGIAREYRLHYPAKAASGPLPVVLNWHGLGSHAAAQEAYSGLLSISDREGFILVSPEGLGTPRGFAAVPGLGGPADDVQFARDILTELQQTLCTDPVRVYSTGLSDGAFMSSRLGCELSDRIAAIAPVAGISYPKVDGCGVPVPVLAFHGTSDPVVPFEPGRVLGIFDYEGARANINQWAKHDAAATCATSPPAVEQLSPHVTRETSDTCGGPSVSLVVVEGGGHTWPGAIPVLALGPTTNEISAAEMIWAFFKDLRLKR